MTGNQMMSHCVRPQLLYSHDVELHLWWMCRRLEDITMWSQLSCAVASFSLDQHLFDYNNHHTSDYTLSYKYIFRLALRLVLLGLVRDYENFFHITAFVFSYSWPQTLIWYIFHMDLHCILLASMYVKSKQNVMSN
jgi:hypothetical protein